MCAAFSNNLLAVLENLRILSFSKQFQVFINLQSNKCMDGHSALTKSAIYSRAL